MYLPRIENLEISKVTDEILLIHQIKPPFHFSCCDGLVILPKNRRNSNSIVLDLNIEPHLIKKVNEIYGPVSNYVCSHGHMDHITHVHQWESLGTSIYAPFPESTYLLNLKNFYRGFGFNKVMDYSIIQKFGEINGYKKCKKVNHFKPGDSLEFEDFTIETIPFLGHSKAHIGFLLAKERIIHISCLGFDQPNPSVDGFGPWYGFDECSIDQYLKDIDLAEDIFLEQADFLTSSHSYIVKNPDSTPFNYTRDKIRKNQTIVDQAILSLKPINKSRINLANLLELDLFFPKKKMKGFLLEIYNYWESGIISKHLERSKYIK
ncbi:MAG: MBL fold metallo-hydrolase [Candidatus Hermodarchaeota archaeon]